MIHSPDENLVRRVFAGYEVTGRPLFTVHGWKAWERPRRARQAPIALDDEVQGLIRAKGQEVGLRPREELQARGISCPYYHARMMILSAKAWADEDLRTYEVEKENLEGYKENKSRAMKLAAELQALRDAIRSTPIAPAEDFGRSKTDWAGLRGGWMGLPERLEEAVATVEAVAEAFEKKRAFIAERRGGEVEIWQRYFVIRMGRAWFDLTGREPAQTGGKFHAFVEAASTAVPEYALGRNTSSEARIRTAIREAKKLLPDWDRWDRQIDGPDVVSVSGEEMLSRSRQLRLNHLAHMRELGQRAREGDHEARRVLGIELALAEAAGDEEKALIAREALKSADGNTGERR